MLRLTGMIWMPGNTPCCSCPVVQGSSMPARARSAFGNGASQSVLAVLFRDACMWARWPHCKWHKIGRIIKLSRKVVDAYL